MRICFVSKYPPIQGGVSAQTYWAVRGLAERGHQVAVVTNADEVEQSSRILLEPVDVPYLESEFANGGAVRVFRPEHYSRRMSHIPMSNPFVSKLAGMALRVVEEAGCDVMVGSYYEPYGMAAWLAASLTSTPLLLQHAGSDLDRLMRLPELGAIYKRMLRAADGVITRPELAGRFIGMGVRPEALRMGPPDPVPAPFAPDAIPLSPTEIERLSFGPPNVPRPRRAFDPSLPTIGMYGKPGETKGTYDLIAALGTLVGAGLDFNLMLLSGTRQQQEIRAAAWAAGLDDRMWTLPFLPHWRVPGFIRACTAVCFLERDLPIASHGPVAAREVLTCGTCLVLSGEIHAKQRNPDQFTQGENIVLVPDPKDREMLAKQLRAVIEDPAGAVQIGRRGHATTTEFAAFGDYIDAWEDLVRSARPDASGAMPASQAGLAAMDLTSGSVTEKLAETLVWARPLLGSEFDELVRQFIAVAGELSAIDEIASPVLARRFCDFILGKTEGSVHDVVRYQRARQWAMRDDGQPAPVASNALGNRAPTPQAIRELYPFRYVPARIERFEHDVTSVLCVSDGSDVTDPPAIPVLICFAQMPNMSSTELRLNAVSAQLLENCTGGKQADELVAEITASLAQNAAADPDLILEQALTTLARFYNVGVVGFASRPTSAAPLIYGFGISGPGDRG